MFSGDAKTYGYLVDFVSDLVLHVHLGPTGEKQLYHVSMTTVASQHEGTLAILRRQNILYNIVLQTTFESCMYRVKFSPMSSHPGVKFAGQ